MILYINGTNRTEFLLKNSLYVKSSIGNQTDVCDFTLHDSTSTFKVQENDYVVIEEDSANIFSGYVVATVGNKIGVGTTGSVTWTVTCKDVSIQTDSPVFDVSYVATSDEDIVTALVSGWFDLSSDVSWTDSSVDIVFENETLRECLNKLAQATDSFWFIDANAELHWRNSSLVSYSSKIIHSQLADEVTAFAPLKGSRIQRDSSNIINKIKIYGGLSANALRTTDTFSFSAGIYTYQLDNYPIQSIRGISYYVGAQLTYSFGSSVSSVGLGEGSLPISMNQTEGTITFEDVTPDNATDVVVDYYYQTEIYYEANNYESQGKYGLFERVITDQTITNQSLAEAKAQAVVDEYAFPRETIAIDLFTSGFTAGDVIYCYVPELDILPIQYDYLVQEDADFLLLENDDYIALESNQKQIIRQIQEVVISYDGATNQLFSTLTIGKTSLSIIKTLGSLQALGNQSPQKFLPSKLSNFTPDLGIVTAGLGLFTDGGTATFSWDNYAGHTGVIVGVEDFASVQRGLVSVIDSGVEKVRVGYLADLDPIGTVQPSGWGIHTDNGYFEGLVYGSTVEAGTVKGNTISGGTITGSLISGGTVTGNTFIGGTIATSTPPINSGNPGVFIDSSGLYGYDSVGLTFRLSSNGAVKPYFSSGTITEAIYEVSTNAVIRTSTSNPKVQIDNSGIFGYDSGGVLRFSFDTGTGYLQAVNGSFSGTVSSSLVTAGTVSGNTISGGTVTGAQVTAGTVAGNLVSGGTVSGALITGGTVTLASGSVSITDAKGLRIETDSSSTYSFNKAVNFENSSNTKVASVYAYESAGNSSLIIQAGKFVSNDPGYINIQTGGTHSNIYSYYRQMPSGTAHVFGLAGTTPSTYDLTHLKISYDLVEFRGDLVPTVDDTYYVGNTTNQIKGIYLHDQSTGTTRLLRINNGTVLVT